MKILLIYFSLLLNCIFHGTINKRRERSTEMYICIDLKSFYASVECVRMGLNPMTTCLVVADASRTAKTICLAVSPALKSFGIPGRPRLFEVNQRVKVVNTERKFNAPGKTLRGKSSSYTELMGDRSLALDFIITPPRMAHYMEYSTKIYNIYLQYIAPEDIHVYSVDEVFIDCTNYLKIYKISARDLAIKMIRHVLRETGITATVGIGTNMYLAKIAMDIEAKHMPADEDGVRIAELDEMSYRQKLWSHTPITDFWRVGKGYAKKLADHGMKTMGDVALCSHKNEDLLYKMFGVNAELLIDHAWGYEPCTIAQIKAYRPQSNSLGSGQVLQCPYSFEKAKLIAREMTDLLVLELVEKRLVTSQIILDVGYDTESLTGYNADSFSGEITDDRYGRKVPKPAHGSSNLPCPCSSTKIITDHMMELFDRVVDPRLLVRRLTVTAAQVVRECDVKTQICFEQMDMFTDYEAARRDAEQEKQELEREKKIQKAVISIKKKHGKNALIKGMNLCEGATTISRNGQIGGHKA